MALRKPAADALSVVFSADLAVAILNLLKTHEVTCASHSPGAIGAAYGVDHTYVRVRHVLCGALKLMKSVCRHCENRIDGMAYRVVSQYNGSILLDMIVCDRCAMTARRLGLVIMKMDARVECKD